VTSEPPPAPPVPSVPTEGPVARRAATEPRLAGLFVPVGSLLLFAMMVALVLSVAGKTLGYDYGCYAGAARDLLNGQPIYHNAFTIDVPVCPGTYTYPPAFAVALIPWISLGGVATVLWCVAMAACFLAGVALMPVRRDVRWLMVILGALNWPLLYAVKLGQVEPILLLGFAATWRWMDRAGVVGAATAVGTLMKVQPGLLAIWAVATGRFRAAVIGVSATVALAVATAGSVAYQAGASQSVATVVQFASMAVVAAALLVAWRFASPVASLQVTIIASQLLASPIRDHYAVLLFLPTAWLVARGRTWAIVFPLAGWIGLLSIGEQNAWLVAASVPLAFFACLAAVLVEGLVERRRQAATPSPLGRESVPL
jgi:hypothetical protein